MSYNSIDKSKLIRHRVYLSSTDDRFGRKNPCSLQLHTMLQNIVAASLVQFSIPKTHYNITDKNNKLHIVDDADENDFVTITHQNGNYSINEIVTNLNTLYDAASKPAGWDGTSAITYDATLGKASWSVTGNPVTQRLTKIDNSIYGVLGWEVKEPANHADNFKPVEGTSTVNFIKDLFLHCSFLQSSQTSAASNSHQQILAKIHDSQSFGSLYEGVFADPMLNWFPEKNINLFEISLREYDGDAIEMNSRWSIVLDLFENPAK